MKNIFKSTKTRNSLVGGLLAAISLFTFNFTPINIISSKLAHAAKYEATETKITENTSSTQIEASELASNLKEYFASSNKELNLSDYYASKYQELMLDKVHEYLLTHSDYKTQLGTNSDIAEYFSKAVNQDYLEFIYNFISNLNAYKETEDANDRKSLFYSDLAVYIGLKTTDINSSSEDGITDQTTDFYEDSDSYKLVKSHIDEIIKETIAIVSYDGTDGNKVAAIIADNAPSQTNYQYGSSYEKHTDKYFEYSSSSNIQFSTEAPFFYTTQSGTLKQYATLPYETNTNGSLVVYAITDGSASRNSTYEFLGYKPITLEEIGNNPSDYFAVPYSTSNTTEASYFKFLYKQLISNNKINGENITEEQFIELFYTKLEGMAEKDSILLVKYDSTKTYLYNIYVSAEDYAKLGDQTHAFFGYEYTDYVSVINSDIKDYVEINSTNTQLMTTYKSNQVGDVTLYFKNQIEYYTEDEIIYLTDGDGEYIYETELKLKLNYEETAGEKNIYVLDDSDDASENKIYQSLGYSVITSPTIEYVKIESTDDNYSENFSLYYKYADVTNVFAKNLLTLSNAEPKNAIYVLSSSVESDLTALCKQNGYIPVSKDEVSKGFFTKLNSGDPNYSTQYELYYKYDVYELSNGTYINAEKVNKIYQYTSATSDYYGFYKTDADYNIENYTKISKTDKNYEQGLDLYYKKQTTTNKNNIVENTTYNFASKTAITFSKNSYYAISFYVNTTGTNVSASVELVDENNYLNDAKITNIQTNGKWVKYYLFIATNLLNDSKAKLTLSMGSTEGIADFDTIITGSVLFDDVVVYKINKTDYNKQTINNEPIFATNENSQKVDSIKNNNELIIAPNFSARMQNDAVIANWNSIFNFDQIDSSVLSNSETYGGNLQNIDISKIDGYSAIAEDWQYYIGRDVSGKNNSELLEAYRKAYKTINEDLTISSDVEISIAEEKTEKSPTTDDNDDSSTEDSSSNVAEDSGSNTESGSNEIIAETFNSNNKILKINNNSASMSLGVVSKSFSLNSSECYKISLWIYSPDKKATATIKLISHILTAQNNEYGIELSAGASDIKAYLDSDDTTSSNEYRWLPVEFYVQGNILSSQEVSLVLLADENSTIYFDNIKIEKITSTAYTNASASTDSRIFKLSLTDSDTTLSKVVTNGFFNDKDYTDLDAKASAPLVAQSWTITSDAAQDYVTAGVISSKNQDFINEYNGGAALNNVLATNMYAINVKGTEDNPTANHKIYSSSKISLSANSVYKITFEYYYSSNNFEGDVISNLYYDSYKTDNKISSIRTSISNSNENADKWNSITFFVSTGSTSVSAILELGVEDANGTLFIRNAYATTITKTLNQIRSEYATENNGKYTLTNDKINICDFSTYSSTMTGKEEDSIIPSTEYTVSSTTTETETAGKTGVIIADYFTQVSETQKTITVDNTTYYLYNNNGTLELYKYPKYYNTTLENNEKLETINNQEFVIRDGKVIVGTGSNEKEYEITEVSANKFNYIFENDATIGNTTIAAEELSNAQSNNVYVLVNENETDYSKIESKYKMTLNSSSYYVLRFYVKTSDFEKENFGLSINITATNLDISWNEDLINTTKVADGIYKDTNGFVCYQMIISTKKSSYSDLIFKISLGDETNTGKGYAIISKVELSKLSSEDEYKHYTEIFANEDDDSIVKTTEGTSSSSTTNSLNTDSEVTWATFFYIFSSLLLVIVLVIAMVAVFVRKHPIKHKKKIIENENFDIETSTKTKEKINKDQETKSEGGIE